MEGERLARRAADEERLQDQPNCAALARFFLRTRERRRDRLYYVLDQLFVPKQVDLLSWPLPAALFSLYYAFRPLRLGYKFFIEPVRRGR